MRPTPRGARRRASSCRDRHERRSRRCEARSARPCNERIGAGARARATSRRCRADIPGSTRRRARSGGVPAAAASRGAARSRPGRGSRDSRSRTPARRSRGRARLAVAELTGRVRLHDVVDPGRPAADVLLRRLDDLEPGDPRERRPRREREPLGVAEVARVLQRDPSASGCRDARGASRRGARRRRAPWRRTPPRARRRGASRAPSDATRSPTS